MTGASYAHRFPLSYKPLLSPWREAESMPRVAYPGSRGYCRPRQGDSNAHSFAQSRTLRIRQGHSLNGSTVCSTSPLPAVPHCALALTDFHRVSRAVGPNWQGRKPMELLAGLSVSTKAVERTAEAIGGILKLANSANCSGPCSWS